MEVTGSPQFFEENFEASEEDLIPSIEKEAMERYLDINIEPSYLFKGVILGLFFCIPFWAILFWLID